MKREKQTEFSQNLGYSWSFCLQVLCLSEIRQPNWHHQHARQICQRKNKSMFTILRMLTFQFLEQSFYPALLPYALIVLNSFYERIFFFLCCSLKAQHFLFLTVKCSLFIRFSSAYSDTMILNMVLRLSEEQI